MRLRPADPGDLRRDGKTWRKTWSRGSPKLTKTKRQRRLVDGEPLEVFQLVVLVITVVALVVLLRRDRAVAVSGLLCRVTRSLRPHSAKSIPGRGGRIDAGGGSVRSAGGLTLDSRSSGTLGTLALSTREIREPDVVIVPHACDSVPATRLPGSLLLPGPAGNTGESGIDRLTLSLGGSLSARMRSRRGPCRRQSHTCSGSTLPRSIGCLGGSSLGHWRRLGSGPVGDVLGKLLDEVLVRRTAVALVFQKVVEELIL